MTELVEGPAWTFDRPAWMTEAACRGTDVGQWFPNRGDTIREQVAVCNGCPVRVDCLEYALAAPIAPSGVWGGVSERTRRALRRDGYRVAPCAWCSVVIAVASKRRVAFCCDDHETLWNREQTKTKARRDRGREREGGAVSA